MQILRNALTKTFNRISDLRKEISLLKKGVISAAEAASRAQAELANAKSNQTLTLVDGEPVLAENPAKMRRLNSNAEKTKQEEISTRESLEAKEALLARAVDEIEVLQKCLQVNSMYLKTRVKMVSSLENCQHLMNLLLIVTAGIISIFVQKLL